ncbi:transcriptional accessory protein [Suhomyces tanzawaensis NRRL Y-17324]|uniref:TATA-binding protein-associated factor mot1 n=1 Tax=Suhomyces tanzawaensis NRRL Y-17324 TaxID=984487 RepID=A0A1E4SJX9_9ASCO|nr:transcriptional accessory protein [Suhomyces tanzawaensis NRRL Y-17324]ODV79811.1 transcriptional accessory protein [Suhomyces tanzawaensis NRRL Y-17324]
MSRLERLVILLETGSTPFIRNTAADQLSDLARGHPEEIINLLGRVYPYLRSNKWETRIAAARAFGGIVNHADLWDPNGKDHTNGPVKQEEPYIKTEDTKVKLEDETKIKLEQDEELKKLDDNLLNLVSFESFDLAELLKSGKRFLASRSDDDPVDSGFADDSLMGKLKKHRTSLGASEVDHQEVKSESPPSSISPSSTPPIKAEQSPPPSSERPSAPSKSVSSARLKAMQKRRAKANAKSAAHKIKPIDISQSSISRKLVEDGEESVQSDSTGPQFDVTSQQGGEKLVVETKAPELSPLLSQHAKVAGLVWQFQGVYELLLADIFDDKWEIRHGAALGLRELIKKHGKGVGRVMKKSLEENDYNNAATLEDLAVRLCTLFSLDRFGDYVSDTVVAPVRESGAQTLAALFIHLSDDAVIKTFNCLYAMVLQENMVMKCWEAKHGGMLGVRYFVSVRTDVLLANPHLLDMVVNMVLHGLQESDDDVQSVAALILAPIANQFVSIKQDLIHTLLTAIWDSLVNLRDDLSASIGSVMDLLAKLCTHNEVIKIMQKDATESEENTFEKLIPRLYPFLRHSITNVRKAVLRTIIEFLSIKDSNTKGWIDSKTMRLIFQNLLVEQNPEVLLLSAKVYDSLLEEIQKHQDVLPSVDVIFSENFQPLLTLLMTPIGISRHNYQMDTNLIVRPSGHNLGSLDLTEDEKKGKKRKASETIKNDIPFGDDLKVNIDAPIFKGDVMLVGYDKFIATRSAAAHAIGNTLSFVDNEEILKQVFEIILNYLNSPHATPRLFSALVIEEYATALKNRGSQPSAIAISLFGEHMLNLLQSPESIPNFRELVPTLKSVRTSCLQLFDVFVTTAKLPPAKIPQLPVVVQGEAEAGPGAFNLENAESIITETFVKLKKNLSATYRMSANQALEDSKHRIQVAIDEAKSIRTHRVTGILAAYAGSILALTGVPKKLNPIIRTLMDSVKQEETLILQEKSAKSVACLIEQLCSIGKKGAADKIVKNLCAFLCVDTSEVPEFHHNVKFKDIILSLRKEEAKTDPADIAAHERAVHDAKIKRNGAILSLEALLDIYGEKLFEEVPKLKEIMIEPLNSFDQTSETPDDLKGQSIIDALGVLRALLPKMHKSLCSEITDKLSLFFPGLSSDYSVFRYSTAKCLATICSVAPTKAFTFLIKTVLPMLNNAGQIKERQGAIETIYHISTTMGSDILPYIVFLIVPVLGRMSDSDQDVRVLATTTFAAIIKLVPLEAGIPDPDDMPQELLEGRDRERDFIQQMMDPTKIKPFDLPVSIKATLRKYQQEGVNWLAFLNKYHLHGILCDDMGLGKTLQTICIVSSDHYIREEKFKETQAPEFRKLPSLIICPPSLTGHWEQELNQYAPFLKVLVYAGGPSVRAPLRAQIPQADVVVTSYDVARNDVDHVTLHDYNYCVLDEGHIIKNAASKLTKSVKRVRAEHRLILSGTPIQNNVLELWSLFDFLMPGFLGTEKIFHEKFAKPIAASRNSKTSSKEQEAGALALESLHKQVLPFMLRRLKEDVLSDLPPKIIQDYYCELSDLQKELYKDFAKKQKSTVLEEVGKPDSGSGAEAKTHVFQALQYMRKLCNHPALVLSPDHPKFAEVTNYLQTRRSDIRSIEHAPKLLSLKTLLLECGIGVNDSSYSSAKFQQKQKQQMITTEGVISEHRALIFCQLKDMLDIVENELLRKHLPSVTFMRLDGSTDPRERQSIVRKFNEDPSIDVLLLTTKVGGLGLNLTGADTVIFVEHDWNPMNDLQAMDRAHRLGQKKVVNVYRLITKNTLEEKIMGLQKFKMNIASTIVNQQNAGLNSMDTNQLLDLFDVDESATKLSEAPEAERENNMPDDVAGGLTGKAAGAVGELADLWDESQYEEEYNLDNFIKTLK